jgi:hypothetical protein
MGTRTVFKDGISSMYGTCLDQTRMYRQLTPQLFESIEIRCDDTLISGHIFTPKIQNPSTPSPGALHDFKFIGPLHQWPLLDHVTQTDQRQKWSKRVIKYTQQARDLEAETLVLNRRL